jgi:hypothetical protein
MWQSILGIIAALGLTALLTRQILRTMDRKRHAPETLFREAKTLLSEPRTEPGPTVGSYRLIGLYHDLPVQVQTVIDTLNVRKLPSLWLMVTMPEPLPLRATFDLMMRPSGPTTFSNFDALPFTIERPTDFPEYAVIRTDDPDHILPGHVVRPHLGSFFGASAKELLLTPRGLRMVIQLGEGDRARYGVFRQAEFGKITVDTGTLRDVLDRLIALRSDILDWHRKTQ